MFIVTNHAKKRYVDRFDNNCKNPTAEILKLMNFKNVLKMTKQGKDEIYLTKRGIRVVVCNNKIITLHKMNNRKRHEYHNFQITS